MTPDPLDRRRAALRRLFEWCLDRAAAALAAGNDDAAADWLLIAARQADNYACGLLTSARLEEMTVALAERLGPPPPPRARATAGPQRWLHVISVGYAIGGHTTMLRRWIERDDSGDVHSLAATFMDRLAPPELGAAVAKRGGRVILLGGGPPYRVRARLLRELAWREADRVVLHVHMWDIVPSIAFGVAGGPPVLLVNHADHAFWVGAAAADRVVNLRRAGEVLSRGTRGIERNLLFRIPLPDPPDPARWAEERAALRAELGIPESAPVFLTVGNGIKYEAVGGLDFPAMARRLLAQLPEAFLVAVGPIAAHPAWNRQANPRLIALGAQPAAAWRPIADIYLEGFPFDSHTALLEAAVCGLPAVRIPAAAPYPFSGHDFPLSAIEQPADVEAYLAQALALAGSAELRQARAAALRDAVLGMQGAAAWSARLAELKCAVPDGHTVMLPRPAECDRSFDRFWTAFKQRWNPSDPGKFVLDHARKWDLDTGNAAVTLGRRDT